MDPESSRVMPASSWASDGAMVDGSAQEMRRRIMRLATFQRGYTFQQQSIKPRRSFRVDDDDDLEAHRAEVNRCVKISYGAPQFAVLALYMLLAVHATLLYEYLGAPLSYLAFFTAFARSIDVFTDPIMAWISDSTRSRFGRRIPYMVLGCFFYGLTIVMLLGVGVIRPPDVTATCAQIGIVPGSGEPLYELQGDANLVDVSVAYWYGGFFVLFYMMDTLCNVPYGALAPELSDNSTERESVYLVQNVWGMLGTLIGAIAPPLLETAGLSREVSFFATGVFFAVYYIVTTLNLAANVGERTESYEGKAGTPLVPSTLRSFANPGFRILLISWFIDAVGWYSLAAVLPFYVKYYLQPGKAGIDWISDEIFLGIALGALFISAIIAMPFWRLLARAIGRYRAWLAYNLWNGISNALYIAVQPQDWRLAIIVTVLNGIPFGGKFLSDATLADCIDYDEFTSGERREAAFSMFSAFVPKIVSIPSQALPLAVIGAMGFQQSVVGCDEDGAVTTFASEQSELVRTTIQLIFVFLPVTANVISFAVKTRYPLTTGKQVSMISAGIALHASGLAAEDPITGEIVPSPLSVSEEDACMGLDFDFFFSSEKKRLLATDCDFSSITTSMITQLCTTGAIFIGAVYGVAATFPLLDDPGTSWAPCFLQIVVGLSAMLWVFTFARLKHAWSLKARPFPKPFMRRWLARTEGGNFGDGSGKEDILSTNPELAMRLLRGQSSMEGRPSMASAGSAAVDVEDRRAQFQRAHSAAQRPRPTGRYAGSTRNMVERDEDERDRFIDAILSSRTLV